jgi:uncharacterized membrane protein
VVTSSTTPAGNYLLTITGTSGTLSRTANVILVVQAAGGTGDFAISASPTSQTIDPGSNVDYTTAITPSGGFSGTVTFSVSGLPAGFTATFSPSSIDGTGSSTMTVNAPDGAPVSTLNLTVTGTSGSLAHSTTVMLVVNSG